MSDLQKKYKKRMKAAERQKRFKKRMKEDGERAKKKDAGERTTEEVTALARYESYLEYQMKYQKRMKEAVESAKKKDAGERTIEEVTALARYEASVNYMKRMKEDGKRAKKKDAGERTTEEVTALARYESYLESNLKYEKRMKEAVESAKKKDAGERTIEEVTALARYEASVNYMKRMKEAVESAKKKDAGERTIEEVTALARYESYLEYQVNYMKRMKEDGERAKKKDAGERTTEEVTALARYESYLEYQMKYQKRMKEAVESAKNKNPCERTEEDRKLIARQESKSRRAKVYREEAAIREGKRPPLKVPHAVSLAQKRHELQAFVQARPILQDLLQGYLSRLVFVDSTWVRNSSPRTLYQVAFFLPEDENDPLKSTWIRLTLGSNDTWWTCEWSGGEWTTAMARASRVQDDPNYTHSKCLTKEEAEIFVTSKLQDRQIIVDYNGCDYTLLKQWSDNCFEGFSHFDFGRGACFSTAAKFQQCAIFSPHDGVGLIYSPTCTLTTIARNLFQVQGTSYSRNCSTDEFISQLQPWLTEITCPEDLLNHSDEVYDVQQLVNVFSVIRTIYNSTGEATLKKDASIAGGKKKSTFSKWLKKFFKHV